MSQAYPPRALELLRERTTAPGTTLRSSGGHLIRGQRTWNLCSAVNRNLFPAPCPDSIQDVMAAPRGTPVTPSASTISSPWFAGHTLRIFVQRTSCYTPTFILCQTNSPKKSVMAPHRIFGMVLVDPLQLGMFHESMISISEVTMPLYTPNLQPHYPGYMHV